MINKVPLVMGLYFFLINVSQSIHLIHFVMFMFIFFINLK